MRPTISVISPALIEQILAEARHILATVGMEIRGPALRQIGLEHGLQPDSSGERLLFPGEVIDAALASAPASFQLYNRDGEPHATIGGEQVHFTPGSSGLRILDHRTGEVRSPLTSDFVEYIRLVDGLPHIAYPATAFSTHDIEADVSDAWRLYLCLTNSRKPVVSGAFTEHGVPRMAEMMALFRQDLADLRARPLAIFTITATGNFRYSEDSCQNLLDCATYGIPMEIVPVTLMGLIAPVTLVGAAVFHTVDVLAGIVLAQLVRPGTPVLFGGAPAAFHMREATSPMLAIEALQLDLIYAEIGKRLNLPVQAYLALSDSKFLDAQAGAETFGSALLAALAGINSVSGPGMLDYVMTFSLAKLIFDDEVCGQALRLIQPVAPLEDLPTLALVQAQLADQHLLTAPHTLRHWPQTLYLPGKVYDRTNRESWERDGSQQLEQRAHAEVERRLAAYTPVQTAPEVDRELRRLIESGLPNPRPLPAVPPASAAVAPAVDARMERRQARRRARG